MGDKQVYRFVILEDVEHRDSSVYDYILVNDDLLQDYVRGLRPMLDGLREAFRHMRRLVGDRHIHVGVSLGADPMPGAFYFVDAVGAEMFLAQHADVVRSSDAFLDFDRQMTGMGIESDIGSFLSDVAINYAGDSVFSLDLSPDDLAGLAGEMTDAMPCGLMVYDYSWSLSFLGTGKQFNLPD